MMMMIFFDNIENLISIDKHAFKIIILIKITCKNSINLKQFICPYILYITYINKSIYNLYREMISKIEC